MDEEMMILVKNLEINEDEEESNENEPSIIKVNLFYILRKNKT